jgi:hypothetical protein
MDPGNDSSGMVVLNLTLLDKGTSPSYEYHRTCGVQSGVQSAWPPLPSCLEFDQVALRLLSIGVEEHNFPDSCLPQGS